MGAPFALLPVSDPHFSFPPSTSAPPASLGVLGGQWCWAAGSVPRRARSAVGAPLGLGGGRVWVAPLPGRPAAPLLPRAALPRAPAGQRSFFLSRRQTAASPGGQGGPGSRPRWPASIGGGGRTGWAAVALPVGRVLWRLSGPAPSLVGGAWCSCAQAVLLRAAVGRQPRVLTGAVFIPAAAGEPLAALVLEHSGAAVLDLPVGAWIWRLAAFCAWIWPGRPGLPRAGSGAGINVLWWCFGDVVVTWPVVVCLAPLSRLGGVICGGQVACELCRGGVARGVSRYLHRSFFGLPGPTADMGENPA